MQAYRLHFFLNIPDSAVFMMESDGMKSPWFPVSLVTLVLFFYTGLVAVGGSYTLIMSIFVASPVLIIWMVYRVLKSAPVSDKTFNEYFYEDHPYRKIPDEADNA